jgi:hypothetical protein
MINIAEESPRDHEIIKIESNILERSRKAFWQGEWLFIVI